MKKQDSSTHPCPLAQRAAAVVLASVWASSALAQSAMTQVLPDVVVKDGRLEFRQFGNVEITGSSIVRKEQTQALPVQVITRDEIKRSGLTTLTEVVQSVITMFNFTESAQFDSVVAGYSNAALHGVSNGTLILINGLRLAPFGSQSKAGPERSGVDLNTLILADVDRIEVLSDGASSLYGTDALAGVVNIILRKERNGFEINVDHLRSAGGQRNGLMTHLAWGAGKLQRDGYSVMVSAEFTQRDALQGADRPDASPGRYTLVRDGQTYEVTAPLNFSNGYASPAAFFDTSSSQLVNNTYKNGACPQGSLLLRGYTACMNNVYPGLDIYPRQDTQRLHARFDRVLSADIKAYAEVIYGQHKETMATGRWPFVARLVGSDPNDAGYAEAVALGLDPSASYMLWKADLPGLQQRRTHESLRASAGVQGLWNEWDYRVQAYQSQSKVRTDNETLMTSDGSLVGDGAFDITGLKNPLFFQPLNAGNPLTAELTGMRGHWLPKDQGQTRLDAIELRASRPLWEIDGKEVLLGVGLDGRGEYTEVSQNGIHFDGNRKVFAGYTELQVPVTPDWEINTGLRHDRYSDVGRTTNGKISSRWAINPQWALRGAWGTGFRAPTVSQVRPYSENYLMGQSSYTVGCTPALQAIASRLQTATGEAGTCHDGQFWFYANGNPDLKPEKSTQLSWGLALTPTRNIRLSVDYWRVQVRDTIRFASDLLATAAPAEHAGNYQLTTESSYTPAGRLALFLPMQNQGQTVRSGLDLEAQWRQPTDWGRLNLLAQGTYMLSSRQQSESGAALVSDLGAYSALTDSVTPRVKGRFSVGLARDQWSGQLSVNYTAGYKDADIEVLNMATGEPEIYRGHRVRAFTTVDVMGQYAWTPQVDVRLGMRNVFNQQAPLSFAQTSVQLYGANTIYSNLWGRVVQLGVTARF